MQVAGERKWREITDVRAEAIVCCRCDLCYGRTHVVFGEGLVNARLMIVGEAPGKEEDEQARPFVGLAGKELDAVFARAGLRRDEVWLTNIVRCRAATATATGMRNRAPRADEIKACDLWMSAEIRFVSPGAIVCLGGTPAQALIGRSLRIGDGMTRWYESKLGIPATVTYHPAYIRRFGGKDRSGIEEKVADVFRMARSRATCG